MPEAFPRAQGDGGSTQDQFEDQFEDSIDVSRQRHNDLRTDGVIYVENDVPPDYSVNQEKSCKKPALIQVVIAFVLLINFILAVSALCLVIQEKDEVNEVKDELQIAGNASASNQAIYEVQLKKTNENLILLQQEMFNFQKETDDMFENVNSKISNFQEKYDSLFQKIETSNQQLNKVDENFNGLQQEMTIFREKNDYLFKTVKSNFSNVQVQYDSLSQKIDGNFDTQQASYDKTNEKLNLLQETSDQQLDEVDENIKSLQQEVSIFQGENDNMFKTVNLNIQGNYNSLYQRILDLQAKLQIDDVQTEQQIDDVQTEQPIDDVQTEQQIDDVQTEQQIDDVQTEQQIDDLQTKQQIDDDKNSGWTWRVRGWKYFMMVLGLPYLTMLLIKI